MSKHRITEMEPFTKAFHEIDENKDGVITREELQNFVRKNCLVEEKMIESWMKLFDDKNAESITLRAYQKKLGLLESDSEEEAEVEQRKFPSTSCVVDEETREISANMSSEKKFRIKQQVCKFSFDKDGERVPEAKLSARLKHWLDLEYGRVWHVIIIRGSYWMNFAHEPDCSLQFHYGSHVFVMWRTPDD